MDVLDVALEWLRHDGGQVAIHDATNSTVVRRSVAVTRLALDAVGLGSVACLLLCEGLLRDWNGSWVLGAGWSAFD